MKQRERKHVHHASANPVSFTVKYVAHQCPSLCESLVHHQPSPPPPLHSAPLLSSPQSDHMLPAWSDTLPYRQIKIYISFSSGSLYNLSSDWQLPAPPVPRPPLSLNTKTENNISLSSHPSPLHHSLYTRAMIKRVKETTRSCIINKLHQSSVYTDSKSPATLRRVSHPSERE